jgi:phosphatidylserine decarboxylase
MANAKQRGNKIAYTIIYLAPGDYHRYHSAADVEPYFRRHIAGYLEPVKPEYLEKHKNVLKENERVGVFGAWKSGLFITSYIGALNVGSIHLNHDEDLKTNEENPVCFNDLAYKNLETLSDLEKINLGGLTKFKKDFDLNFSKISETGETVNIKKGEETGYFNFGSTIALVFECPDNFKWTIKESQKLQVGEPLN